MLTTIIEETRDLQHPRLLDALVEHILARRSIHIHSKHILVDFGLREQLTQLVGGVDDRT